MDEQEKVIEELLAMRKTKFPNTCLIVIPSYDCTYEAVPDKFPSIYQLSQSTWRGEAKAYAVRVLSLPTI